MVDLIVTNIDLSMFLNKFVFIDFRYVSHKGIPYVIGFNISSSTATNVFYTLNNILVNGHSNIMQNSSGKSSSNNVTSNNSIDWIELKTANRTNARFPAPKPPSSSYGEVKKNDVIIPQFISSIGNLSVRLAPLPRRMHQYSIP